MSIARRYPILLFVIGNGVALLLGVIIMISLQNPPRSDVELLILFMGGTASLSLACAYVLYRLDVFRRFQSLGWTFTISIAFTVLIVLVNVWIVARLMFINPHDFALMTALLAFGGLTAITFGGFISSALSEGIRELAQANTRLAKGDLSVRLAVKGTDELSQLARTFNQMAASLQQVDEQKRMLDQTRRDLVAWVSHDLRTPLTSMRVLIEAILDGVAADPETVDSYLRSARKEIEHLSRLIDDLFELAQLDANEPNIHLKLTALQELLREAVAVSAPLAEQRGIRLSGQFEPDLPPVMIDPDKIQRVVHNLLDNALRHTPDHGEIDVRLARRDGAVEVEVFNTGSQIAPDDLPHIFDRFYRAERSRRQASGQRRNVGLGLTVARGLIQAHGGDIHAESTPAGTSFRFTLPAASAAPSR